jgi:DNA-binding Lrp family transcriptional regulator
MYTLQSIILICDVHKSILLAEAFVLINCDLGKEKQIIQDLKHIDNVKEIQATFGVYDLIAKIESRTERELKNTIQSKIRKIKPIHCILTLQSTTS